MNSSSLIRFALLLVGLALLAMIPTPLGPEIGATDFRDLWTASYLLAQHENMYDATRVLDIQHALTGWTGSYPLITLSPPWTALLTMPYALLPFARATWFWLLTNIALTGLSAILLWRDTVGPARAHKTLWVAFAVAFGFSFTLTALASGQTTLFVLAMVAGYLACAHASQDTGTGLALAGMTIKPQITFITLLLLGLELLRARHWRTLAGAVLAVVAALGALWWLRPTWLAEYREALAALSALAWESSNVGGVLLVLTGQVNLKLFGLLSMPLCVGFWWRYGARVSRRTMIDASLIVSLIAAPYGFSYDFVVLLAPLLSMTGWIVQRRLSVPDAATVTVILLAADALSFYERILSPSEVYFFWIPLVVGAVYLWGSWRMRQPTSTVIMQESPT